jgi:hypothetical protein
MPVNLSMLWSYAGVSMREDEGSWCDTNRVRMLKERGFGYVAVLGLDGRTRQNVPDLHRIRRDTTAQGMAMVLWVTPRPVPSSDQANDQVPIGETLQTAADMVREYGFDAVRYQTEAEFEYTTGMVGGTPAQRYGSMATLGEAHRQHLGNLPGAVYARVGLGLADAWWTKAWQFGFRCFVENYGPAEGPPSVHPGWAAISGPSSFQPPLVGGWNYRVKLGAKYYFGRINDDGRNVTVDGQGVFPIGSPAGPRYISAFGNPKYGAIVGFFPTSWIKVVEPSYRGVGVAAKPSGVTLAGEILQFQGFARKWGDASKGYSVFVGPEMTQDHFDHISPVSLTGAALLP